MKLYRNHYAGDGDESIGFHWFASKAAALKHAKGKEPIHGMQCQIATPLELTPTRDGFIAFLNCNCSYPDNG